MKVPFYSVARTVHDRHEDLRRMLDRLDFGTLVDGPLVAELEQRLAAYTGARHVIAVGSGTDALAIMLRACGVGPGDEVIVPAYTFFATASTVIHVGATPVFVDVSPVSYAMDPDRVREAVTPRTKAIVPAHMFAQMADVHRLRALADERGLLLLEDSAEAIGMRMDGVHAGRWGLAGVLSFFPTKTLGAFGDAGAVLTDDDEFAAIARDLARGVADGGAWASGCDEVAAAILLFRLERLDAEIARRAAIADLYTASLTPLTSVQPPRVVDGQTPTWYVYLIEADRRDELAAHLAAAGIETEAYYPRPLTAQPCFTDENSVRHPVPVADAACLRALGLPLYADLTDEQIGMVTAAITQFFGGGDA